VRDARRRRLPSEVPSADTTQLIAELEAKLSPGPARCLVGSTVCLVTADDATGAVTRPAPGPAEEAGPWRVVSCGECDAVLGAKTPLVCPKSCQTLCLSESSWRVQR
jgi:hypothetical protein